MKLRSECVGGFDGAPFFLPSGVSFGLLPLRIHRALMQTTMHWISQLLEKVDYREVKLVLGRITRGKVAQSVNALLRSSPHIALQNEMTLFLLTYMVC